MKRIIFGVILTLLLIGVSPLTFNIQPAKADMIIICIRADGSVDPPDAPISSADNTTYTFTGDIYGSISVQRNDIVIDGAGHIVREGGMELGARHNITVKNTVFMQCGTAMTFNMSSDLKIFGNTFRNNRVGLCVSSGNLFYHNNFINNTDKHVYTFGDVVNDWNDTYPYGGNYWDDYTGTDEYKGPGQNELGSDGIGDTAYSVATNNTDYYPLMSPWDKYPPVITSLLHEPSSNIHPGQEVKVVANVSDVISGANNVTLFYTINNGVNWENRSMTGTVKFEAIIPGQDARTNVTYKIVAYDKAGNNATKEGKYFVMMPTRVSILTSSSSTYAGFAVDINGTLCDMYGDNLTNETVVLWYTFQGVGTWIPITSDSTDSFGHYKAKWISPATGYFIIKAEWTGNATHFGVNNNVTLSSMPYENEYVFSVESNSTVSALAFNTTNWELSFTASGPTGTKGFVKITVAKSLVANITNIKVSLDGDESEYSIASMDDSWLLMFNYMHSTHNVIVDLDTTIVPEFPSFVIIPLLMTATLLALLGSKRKRTQ